MDSRLDIRAAVGAGLIAGAAFMMPRWSLSAPSAATAPGLPPRMIAAMVLG
jgi:hypothetical protein